MRRGAYQVRPAEAADFAHMVAVWRATWTGTYTTALGTEAVDVMLRDLDENGAVNLIAEGSQGLRLVHDGKIVGTAVHSGSGAIVYWTCPGKVESSSDGKRSSELLQRNQSSFAYGDYGVPDQQNGYIATNGTVLEKRPEIVAAFMRATLAGYEWAADHSDEAAAIMITVGDFPNADLVYGSMRVIAEGGYLKEGTVPVGTIDGARLQRMADFLAERGVLKNATGGTLEEAGDVPLWYDETWRDQ